MDGEDPRVGLHDRFRGRTGRGILAGGESENDDSDMLCLSTFRVVGILKSPAVAEDPRGDLDIYGAVAIFASSRTMVVEDNSKGTAN